MANASPVTHMDEAMILELRSTVKECSERGLLAAFKWSSDLLLSIPHKKRHPTSQSLSPSRPMQSPFIPPYALNLPSAGDALESKEADRLLAARKYMEAHQYQRAVYALRGCSSSRAVFLSVYSQYLVSERKAWLDWQRLDSVLSRLTTSSAQTPLPDNRHQPPIPVNDSVAELFEMVRDAEDPWLLFLYWKALFLYRLSRKEEAIATALLSIETCPWNWSAWVLLGNCVDNKEEIKLFALIPRLPLAAGHPLILIFQIKVLSELHCPTPQEIDLCDRLLYDTFFPESAWIMSLRGRVLYDLFMFQGAMQQFESIQSMDKYRIDDIDVYSNILYTTDHKGKLSHLAQKYLTLDKNRPEVCCMVGNHYSIRGDHEKAVKYFRRATQLDRTCYHAWTLMGHEYLEMSNTHAAVESYRRAVDVNKKDYRAWYGLGQAYSLLGMHHFAVHYFQTASVLRPGDVSIWDGLGVCYEEIGRPQEAITCFERIVEADPKDPQLIPTHVKLARLYRLVDDLGQSLRHNNAIVWMCEVEASGPLRSGFPDYYIRALLEVAEVHMMNPKGGDLTTAKDYLERVVATNADDQVKAAAIEMLKAVKHKIARTR